MSYDPEEFFTDFIKGKESLDDVSLDASRYYDLAKFIRAFLSRAGIFTMKDFLNLLNQYGCDEYLKFALITNDDNTVTIYGDLPENYTLTIDSNE